MTWLKSVPGFILAGVSLVGIAALLWLLRVPILTGIATFLTVEDTVEPADVILMFPGEVNVRPTRTAELYDAGLAPTIVVPRTQNPDGDTLDVMPNITDAAVLVMQRLGVPPDAIVVLKTPGGSTSTRDDVRIFRDYVERHGIRRVVAVTSMYHTRRARWALHRALDGLSVKIMMAPAPETRFSEDDWWQSEAGLILYFEEYVKWVHNYFNW
ncbi:MAG: YdcF family protein [Longimicrobiales bacterium]